MTFLTPGIGVYDIALIASLLGSAIGFSVGVWFVKRQLESKVSGMLDLGSDSGDDMVMDLSGAVEELNKNEGGGK